MHDTHFKKVVIALIYCQGWNKTKNLTKYQTATAPFLGEPQTRTSICRSLYPITDQTQKIKIAPTSNQIYTS